MSGKGQTYTEQAQYAAGSVISGVGKLVKHGGKTAFGLGASGFAVSQLLESQAGVNVNGGTVQTEVAIPERYTQPATLPVVGSGVTLPRSVGVDINYPPTSIGFEVPKEQLKMGSAVLAAAGVASYAIGSGLEKFGNSLQKKNKTEINDIEQGQISYRNAPNAEHYTPDSTPPNVLSSSNGRGR